MAYKKDQATPSTSNLVSRDSGGNASSNNFNTSATAVTSTGGTTVLTLSSAKTQVLQGTMNHTFQLPNATTLVIGWSFNFNNNSTGTLTVVDAASGAVCTVPAGGYVQVFTISVSTSAGAWDKYYLMPANAQYGTASMKITGDLAVSNLTGIVLGNGSSVMTALSYTASTSFTPQLQFGADSTGITYSDQSGRYIRMDNVIFFSISIVLTNKGSATGGATIIGLPTGSSYVNIFPVSADTLTYTGQVNARLPGGGSSTISLDEWASGGARGALTESAFSNTTLIQISGSYII